MKRLYLFFYYCYALQWPVHDTYIFSPALAWELAGIAARASGEPPAQDDPASIADFFTGPAGLSDKDPYQAFGEWAKEHGYDVEDDDQLQAALEVYGGE